MRINPLLLLAGASLLVNVSLTATAQTTEPVTFKINEGDVLVYDVRNKGDLYYYTVKVKEYKGKIAFDWEMSEPIHKKGSVEIKPKALASAMALVNYVDDSTALVLEDATIVWLSRSMFKSIASGKAPDISFDGHTGNKMAITQMGKQTITYKGKPLEVDVIETSNGQDFFDLKKLSILNSADNPLITKMNIGFTVELLEVK